MTPTQFNCNAIDLEEIHMQINSFLFTCASFLVFWLCLGLYYLIKAGG